MTDDELAWLHRLPLDDKVNILRNPHGSLPDHLVQRLMLGGENSPPGVSGAAHWVSQHDSPAGHHILASGAAAIDDQRLQLEFWWENLSDAQRADVVAHRADALSRVQPPADADPRTVDLFFELQARRRSTN